MSGVKLVNGTVHDIILLEGSGGVYRRVKTIPTGKKHVLKVDRHETYREYRCKLPSEISKKSQAVVLTSDDVVEYTHVTIKWDQDTDTLSSETTKPSRQASSSLVRWLVNKLGWRKELSPNDGGGDGGGDGHEEGGGGGGDGGDGHVEGGAGHGGGGGGDGHGGAGPSEHEVVGEGGGGGSSSNNDANVPRHGGSLNSSGPMLNSIV